MTQARLFLDKTKTKSLPTADELLDDLRDKCLNRAERESMLGKLASSHDGMLIITQAHANLMTSYVIYKRLCGQMHPDVDLKAARNFDEGSTIELIQELQTCLGRYLSDTRKHILVEQASNVATNSPRV